MEQTTESNELDLIQVIDGEDDFVQILGVLPNEDGSEIEVSAVEYDEGDSFFIDVDDNLSIDIEDGKEMIDVHENVSSDNSFESDDTAGAAEVI